MSFGITVISNLIRRYRILRRSSFVHLIVQGKVTVQVVDNHLKSYYVKRFTWNESNSN